MYNTLVLRKFCLVLVIGNMFKVQLYTATNVCSCFVNYSLCVCVSVLVDIAQTYSVHSYYCCMNCTVTLNYVNLKTDSHR